MTVINSVLGPVETTDLGFTLMHEHLMVAPAGVYESYPELLGANFMDRLVDRLKEVKEGGVDTIADASTFDLGRNVKLLAEASRRTGINIIACTGWWMDYPRYFEGVSADQFAEIFIRDVEEGIGGTGIKAGILKSASDIDGVTSEGETVLRAVARAHHKTGVPIVLHSYSPGQVGRQQLDILRDEGVGLKRVKLEHSNDTTDLEYLTWILEQGCFLGLDRYPGKLLTPIGRTKTMKALIDAGYADRLCPSHDWSIIRVGAENPPISEEERQRLNPHGFLYIKKVVFPQLRDMGVSEEILSNLCVDGPRNFFEGA